MATARLAWKIIRARDWIHQLGLPLLGYVYSNGVMLDVQLLPLLLVAALLLATAYSLNEIFDRKLCKKYVLIPLSLGILALTISNLTSFKIFEVVLLLLIAITYSIPPLRLENVPLVCTLLNGIGFALLFSLGLTHVTFESILLVFFVFLNAIGFQLVHEISHLRIEDKFTTAKLLGTRSTISLAKIFFFSAFLVASLLFPLIPFLSPLSWVFFLMSTSKLKHVRSRDLKESFRKLSIAYGILLLFSFIAK